MIKLHYTAPQRECAVLVAVAREGQSKEITQIYTEELAFLAETLDIQVSHIFTQNLEKPDFRTYVGKGKLLEIKEYVLENAIDMVIFDDDLSPSQVRNLEREINGEIIDKAKCKILDRSLLILDIFSLRAQTVQAKTQVELAQYQYLLPRLTRMWTHLSKQKGGIGMRGPGEKELETDRRIINDKIALLKDKLKKIDKQSTTRRKARESMVRLALVGYTNVGKSTLMKLLSKSDVFAENKLFATVDSTVRKINLNGIPFLLTDTVGFIRKLPTLLIESFKSTLDEIKEADILLHVADISSPQCEEQIAIVNQTLIDIKAADKPTLLILNKIDLVDDPNIDYSDHLKVNDQVIRISALNKENIEHLRQLIFEMAWEKYRSIYPNYVPNYSDNSEN
ncbi:MAG: GTPase HflX [Microscillaceae bacterium]|nr:GTPase HflX [Microscillaceae bacterium]